MSTKYDLEIRHNGIDTGDFCIYQTQDTQCEDFLNPADR